MHAYYERDEEADTLDGPLGQIEFLRTVEVLERVLPDPPAVIADVGGGPGRYTRWLVERGYRVEHRDLVPLHVEHVRRMGLDGVRAAVGDARELELPDARVDAVPVLGPLYHLPDRADRIAALREAGRVVRPGGTVVAAAISRWAPRLHGLLVERAHDRFPQVAARVGEVEATGLLPPPHPAAFCGYVHRPQQLADEIADAGLALADLVGVEGLAFAVAGLAEKVASPSERTLLLDSARAIERVPELLGLSPHLLAVAARR